MEVFRGGARLATLTVAAIQSLPSTTAEAGGESKAGPTLRSVLKAAGVSSFRKVTVFGVFRGRVAEGEITLRDDEVTDQVVLTQNQRGEWRLFAPSVTSEQWIVDVKRLSVE